MIDPALSDDQTPPVPMKARSAYLRMRPAPDDFGRSPAAAAEVSRPKVGVGLPQVSRTLLVRSRWRLEV